MVPPALTISGGDGKSRALCLQRGTGILDSVPLNRGGRSSMVEPQIVVLVVAGSSPVGHPWNFRFTERNRQPPCSIGNLKSKFANFTVPVAQLDRASDFGSEGWGFESLQARH